MFKVETTDLYGKTIMYTHKYTFDIIHVIIYVYCFFSFTSLPRWLVHIPKELLHDIPGDDYKRY